MEDFTTESEAVGIPQTEVPKLIEVVAITSEESEAVSSTLYIPCTPAFPPYAVPDTSTGPSTLPSPAKVTTSCLVNTLTLKNVKFPEKLHILACDESIEFLFWSPDGKSLIVHSQEYENCIMERSSGFTKSPSFINLRRQLRNYGFSVKAIAQRNWILEENLLQRILEKWPLSLKHRMLYMARHPSFTREMTHFRDMSIQTTGRKLQTEKRNPSKDNNKVPVKYRAICANPSNNDSNVQKGLPNHTTMSSVPYHPVQDHQWSSRLNTVCEASNPWGAPLYQSQNMAGNNGNLWQHVLYSAQPLYSNSDLSPALYTLASQNLVTGLGDTQTVGGNTQLPFHKLPANPIESHVSYLNARHAGMSLSSENNYFGFDQSSATYSMMRWANYQHVNPAVPQPLVSALPSPQVVHHYQCKPPAPVTNGCNDYGQREQHPLNPWYGMQMSPNTGAVHPVAYSSNQQHREHQGLLDLSNFHPLSSSTPVKTKVKANQSTE